MNDGFAGVNPVVRGVARDGAHEVSFVDYQFADGSVVPYVEVREHHDMPMFGRFAVSTLCHAMLNLGDVEVFVVGNRQPGAGASRDRRIAELEALTLRLLQQLARLAEAFPDAAWTLRPCPHGDSQIPCELCRSANGSS